MGQSRKIKFDAKGVPTFGERFAQGVRLSGASAGSAATRRGDGRRFARGAASAAP